MVDNPHLFKNSVASKHKEKEEQMDEIERLVNIFAKFYNEEKVKGTSVSQKGRIDKKVSMLPMKTTLNIFASKNKENSIQTLDQLKAMLDRDLGLASQGNDTTTGPIISDGKKVNDSDNPIKLSQFTLIEEAGEQEEKDSIMGSGSGGYVKMFGNGGPRGMSGSSGGHGNLFGVSDVASSNFAGSDEQKILNALQEDPKKKSTFQKKLPKAGAFKTYDQRGGKHNEFNTSFEDNLSSKDNKFVDDLLFLGGPQPNQQNSQGNPAAPASGHDLQAAKGGEFNPRMQDSVNQIFAAEPSQFDSTFPLTATMVSKNTTQNVTMPLREINSGTTAARHPQNLDAVFEQPAASGEQ